MKIGNYNIFPRKMLITIYLNGGSKFNLICDKFEINGTIVTYNGLYTKYKALGYLNPKQIAAFTGKPIRLMHIYKSK